MSLKFASYFDLDKPKLANRYKATKISEAATNPNGQVHIITDRPEDECVLAVEPPSQIVSSAWGPPIYLAYLGWQHYEATEWLQTDHSEVAVKPEKL